MKYIKSLEEYVNNFNESALGLVVESDGLQGEPNSFVLLNEDGFSDSDPAEFNFGDHIIGWRNEGGMFRLIGDEGTPDALIEQMEKMYTMTRESMYAMHTALADSFGPGFIESAFDLIRDFGEHDNLIVFVVSSENERAIGAYKAPQSLGALDIVKKIEGQAPIAVMFDGVITFVDGSCYETTGDWKEIDLILTDESVFRVFYFPTQEEVSEIMRHGLMNAIGDIRSQIWGTEEE